MINIPDSYLFTNLNAGGKKMGKKKAIMRKKVLSCFIIFVVLMILVPVSAFAAGNSNISSDGVDTASTDLTIEEVNEIIESATDFILLDIRTEKDHRSGHIYGAMPIPLSELEDGAEGLDEKDRRIIVYDENGVEGKIACDLLIQHGFENVYNMKGGINAWTEAGFATVTYEIYKNTLTCQSKPLGPQLKAMSSHVIGFVDIVFIMDTSGLDE
jgi:rhodanese-related sulfurtransferase